MAAYRPAAAVAPAARGFPGLPCPRCGAEGRFLLRLDNLDNLHCNDCDADLSVGGDIRPLLARWSAVLAWIDQAPPAE